MNYRLKKEFINIEIFYAAVCLAVSVIGARVINTLIDFDQSKSLYCFFIWLIPINGIILAFWFLARIVWKKKPVLKKYIQDAQVFMEIFYFLRMIIYVTTGFSFREFMENLAGAGNI